VFGWRVAPRELAVGVWRRRRKKMGRKERKEEKEELKKVEMGVAAFEQDE